MKSPAFRFYPADFMGSPDVQAMDLHEVGAYMYLLCIAWQSERHGYLSDDDDKLRRWARMSREQWSQSRETLLAKFPVFGSGWRANLRMVREAAKQDAFSKSQSEKGRRGGRPKKAGEKPEVSDSKPELSSGISPEKPSVSVSVSASVFASDTASGAKDKAISVPSEPHPDTSGDMMKKPQLVSIDNGRSEKRKRQDSGRPYDPRFLKAYEAYPKHEEKSISESEWLKAYRRLQKGERDKPPMTDLAAAEFLERAAADFSTKMADREPQFIRSMRRWLHHSEYLEFDPKPREQYRELSSEESSLAWERDFGTHV
jgi:uncharacterized protein YdaU (DUF1376 family)